MKSFLCRYVCSVSRLRIIESAQVVLPAIRHNCGNKSTPTAWATYPQKARLVVALRLAHVLCIYLSGNVSKVLESVICLDPVDVINFQSRVLASYVQPCEAVRGNPFAIDANDQIAIFVQAPDLAASRPVLIRESTSENTRRCVVLKNLHQAALWNQNARPHSMCPGNRSPTRASHSQAHRSGSLALAASISASV